MTDRLPIVPFLLAFIGLIAVALGLAMLSSMPEPAGSAAPAGSQRKSVTEASGTGNPARPVTQSQ